MDLVIQIYPLFPYFWSRHSLAVILDRTDNYAATPSNLSSSYPSSHTSRLLLQTRVVSAVKPAIFSACANQKTGALPYQTPSRLAVILVHRAWQGQKSFLIVAIKLLSTSSVPAAPDFSGDLNIINNIVTSTLATGKAVILVMHSDGAHPGCRVLKVIKQDEAENAMFSNGVTKVGRIVKLALIPRAKRRTVRVEAPNPARALFYEVRSYLSTPKILRYPGRFYNIWIHRNCILLLASLMTSENLAQPMKALTTLRIWTARPESVEGLLRSIYLRYNLSHASRLSRNRSSSSPKPTLPCVLHLRSLITTIYQTRISLSSLEKIVSYHKAFYKTLRQDSRTL
ncbi:hypothetical protein XPA_003290 [Xanthoria parietina]